MVISKLLKNGVKKEVQLSQTKVQFATEGANLPRWTRCDEGYIDQIAAGLFAITLRDLLIGL